MSYILIVSVVVSAILLLVSWLKVNEMEKAVDAMERMFEEGK